MNVCDLFRENVSKCVASCHEPDIVMFVSCDCTPSESAPAASLLSAENASGAGHLNEGNEAISSYSETYAAEIEEITAAWKAGEFRMGERNRRYNEARRRHGKFVLDKGFDLGVSR